MTIKSVQIKNDTNNKKTTRYFWDGGILNNTPLRSLINEHRNYWLNTPKKYVPDLELYVIDVHPSINYEISLDRDGVINRNFDIMYHNRNQYDVKVANIVNDYINFAGSLKSLVDGIKDLNQKVKDDLEKILKTETISKSHTNKTRTYKDLLEGRFNVEEKFHIERRNDESTISSKAFDFSSQTIQQLIKDGISETTTQLHEKH